MSDKRMPYKGVARLDIYLPTGVDFEDIDRDTYVNTTHTFTNGADSNYTSGELPSGYSKIKGAGNTSWTDHPKKGYNFVTLTSTGANLNTTPLGMPSEKDWRMTPNYQDKVFIRTKFANTLSYCWGLPWAARCELCELYIHDSNGERYWGLYTFGEKRERGTNRINIANLSLSDITEPNITGGHVVERLLFSQIDPTGPYFQDEDGFYYQHSVPDPDAVAAEHLVYMKGVIDTFLARAKGADYDDPELGFWAVINALSSGQYYWQNESTIDVDLGLASQFYTKDRNELLEFGPDWDQNGTFGSQLTAPALTLYLGKTIDPNDTEQEFVSNILPEYAGMMRSAAYQELLTQILVDALPDIHYLIADMRAFVPQLIASGAIARDRARWPGILEIPLYIPLADYPAEVTRFDSVVGSRFYNIIRRRLPVTAKPSVVGSKSATVPA